MAHLQIKSGPFKFIGTPNEKGFLAKIETECDAANLRDAEYKTIAALTPFLSHWSVSLDLPLQIFQVDIVELRTGSLRMSMKNALLEVSFGGIAAAELSRDLQSYASVYREALVSNSPIYAFLCYYRIVESIHGRRKRLVREAKTRGQALAFPVEKFPATADELRMFLDHIFPARPKSWDEEVVRSLLFPETVGKEFAEIDEKHLRGLRNSVGHTVLKPDEPELKADDPTALERVNRWLPVVKCMARGLLISDFPVEFNRSTFTSSSGSVPPTPK